MLELADREKSDSIAFLELFLTKTILGKLLAFYLVTSSYLCSQPMLKYLERKNVTKERYKKTQALDFLALIEQFLHSLKDTNFIENY